MNQKMTMMMPRKDTTSVSDTYRIVVISVMMMVVMMKSMILSILYFGLLVMMMLVVVMMEMIMMISQDDFNAVTSKGRSQASVISRFPSLLTGEV